MDRKDTRFYQMNIQRPLQKSIFFGLLCTLVAGTSFSRPLSVQAETIIAYTADSPVGLPEDSFSDHWKMTIKTYTYTPSSSDYITLHGDNSSLSNLNQIKPYESVVENPTTASFQKVSELTVPDFDAFDHSLFSEETMKYTTDEDAVQNYINTHPELAGVTDHRILLPVFEFDRDNDLASYHNYFDTNLANGLLPAGAVGRDNIAVLDPTQPIGQYTLNKTLTYDTEHGFYYIYQLNIGIADVDREITTFVDSNGNETERQGLYTAPATISSYTYDHTDEAVLSPTLDVDAVTERLLNQIKAQDLTQVFANATQVGDIVITKTINDTYSISILKEDGLSEDISYYADGSPRVTDSDGNPIYYDNTFQDILYTTATDDSLAVGEYRITYSLSPLIYDLNRMDSVQHLFVNLVVGTRDDNRIENAVDRTHIYTRVPDPTTPPVQNTPGRTPNTADNSHTSRDALILGISLILAACVFLTRNHIDHTLF